MAAPLIRRRSVLTAEVETTPGTAESPAAADGVLNVYNAVIDPTLQVSQRDGQSSLSQLPGVAGARVGTCSFETDLIGGSSAPKLWTVLALACGMQQATGQVYKPDSRPPEASGSGAETITLSLHEDGRIKTLAGCMGNMRIAAVAGEMFRCFFEFTGVWITPTDGAMVAPTYLTTAPLRFASSGLSVGGVTSLRVGNIEFNTGNEVIMREDSSTASGYHSAVIVGRRSTLRLDPESQLVANYPAFTKLLANTEEAITLSAGSSGNRVQFSFPKAQIVEAPGLDRSGKRCDNLLYQLNRSASAGDDEFSLTVD